jgi:hypothetical protein
MDIEYRAKKSAVAFFTVRTPRARTHQQQLACIAHHVFNRCAESKKRRKFSSFGMHEPACQLLVYTEWTHTHQCTECTHSACLNVYTVYTQQGADRVQTAYTRNNLASKNRLMYSCWCTQCTQCTHQKIVKSAACAPRCSCWCVYPLECTHSVHNVHTVCTHMPNVYNSGASTAVYRTAVPHECTMHGGIRHPDLDLE